ncbi:MAG: hypothetical protein EOP53_21580, partial [Sphingobacteriales bacterium]
MLRFLFLLFLSTVTFSATAQYKHLLHKTYAQRFLALDTLFYNNKVAGYDSTEFFKETNAIKELAIAGKDYELELEADLLRNEYYMIGYDYNHKLFVPRMEALRKIADEQGIRHLQIRVRQKLGYFYFYKVQQYGPGFENYLRAYELMKSTPVSELPDKQEMIASIGTAYYIFGESKIARKFLAEAQKVAPSYKKRLAINNTNTIGLLFRMEASYDSAEYYFRKAYALALADRDSIWMGITSGNIGINYFLQARHTESIPYLEFDIEQSLKGKEVDNAINSSIVLAKVYMIQKEYSKAEKLTRKALSLLYLTGDPLKHKVELYHLLALQFKQAGDLLSAFTFLDSSRMLNIEILDRRSAQIHERAENKVEIEKYKSAVLLEQHNKKVHNFQVQAIAGILILLSIIIILIINRKRVKLKKNHRKLEIEKESIESELEIAERQLLEFTEKIRGETPGNPLPACFVRNYLKL